MCRDPDYRDRGFLVISAPVPQETTVTAIRVGYTRFSPRPFEFISYSTIRCEVVGTDDKNICSQQN